MKAVVVGSANLDLVVAVERLPPPGATVLGDPPVRRPGGKGANQAAGLARLDLETTLVARIGDDPDGDHLRNALAAERVALAPAEPLSGHLTGRALVTVDRTGESTIVVTPGANGHLLPEDLPTLAGADAVVLSLEIPMVTVLAAAMAAMAERALVVLNASPAAVPPEGLLELVSCLVVNEEEARFLARVSDDPMEQAARLGSMGPERVVVTLGPAGCLVVPAPGTPPLAVPGFPTAVVDAVGAGDCVTAALTATLLEPRPLAEAARFAMAAASIVVERQGALGAMPTRAEVDARLGPG